MAGFEDALHQPLRSALPPLQGKPMPTEADCKKLHEDGALVGVLHLVPASGIPYAQLIRLHKPIGFAIVYLPYVIGILYAAAVSPSTLRFGVLLDRAWIFCIGSVVLRSAGCTWDDIVDVDLDRHVERCATRPLVRGAVSLTQAVIFLFGLTTLGIGVLTLLPWMCTADAGIIVILSAIYPYMKRFNHYAQVVLGLTIGFAIIMAMHALDVDPLAEYCRTSTLCLWFSIAILMMLYDIVYAAQDTNDDMKAGVRGMAVRFRSSIRTLISTMASAIIGLLVLCGLCSRLGSRYYIITVGGTGGSLITMISAMDLAVPESCHKYCGGAYILTCISMLVGFGAEYLHRA